MASIWNFSIRVNMNTLIRYYLWNGVFKGLLMEIWIYLFCSASRLAINKIKPSDAGTYQCIITDAELSEVYVQRNLTISVAKKNAGKKEVTAIADYDEEEDAVQDALLGCDNVRSAANFSSDSYLCFDLGLAGHRMSRYHVPAAGTTLTVFCNPRGLMFWIWTTNVGDLFNVFLLSGNSKPSVNWYKDGHPFSQQGYHYRINNNSLIMKEVTDVDSATYTCEAFNSHSRIQYDTVVHVNRKFFFISVFLGILTVILCAQVCMAFDLFCCCIWIVECCAFIM